MKKTKTFEKIEKETVSKKISKITKEETKEPTREILSLTKQLVELDEKYEVASKEKARLYDARKNLQVELHDKMKECDLENFRSAEFGLISRTHKLWTTITDMDLAKSWLEENGLVDEILRLEPITGRLNEVMKERLEKGEIIPPGFDYSMKKGISIRAT